MAKAAPKKKTFKKKERKNIPNGIVSYSASFNNTLISITDTQGNLVAQCSSGARGFRGSRKGTPFAAQQASSEAARKATEAGMREVEVRVKGPGGGRESAIRAINSGGNPRHVDPRYDADPAQRMQAAETQTRLMRIWDCGSRIIATASLDICLVILDRKDEGPLARKLFRM